MTNKLTIFSTDASYD